MAERHVATAALQGFMHTAGSALVAGLLAPALAGHVAGFAAGMLVLSFAGFTCWYFSQRMPP